VDASPNLNHRGLFEASPNPYLVLDRSLNIVGANRAYLESTKRNLEDILGRWAWDAFPTDPQTLKQSVESFQRVIRTRQPDIMPLLRFDIPRPEAEGGGFERRYWSITHTPVLDEAGEVEVVLQHPIDVTELETLREAAKDLKLLPQVSGIFVRAQSVHEANLELKAESDRLRELFSQAPSFIAVVRGPEHRFEMVNEAYSRLVGNRELVGKTVCEALGELRGQGYVELLDGVYRTGQPFVGRGMRVMLESARAGALQERYVDFVFQPIREGDQAVSGIFVIGNDVTEAHVAMQQLRELTESLEQRVEQRSQELRSAEEQLRQAQKMEAIGQLTGGIAHDFNNLLSTITTSLELIQRKLDAGQPGDVARYIGMARKSTRNAASLIHRLLAFSRKQTLDLKPVDTNLLVGELADLLRRTLGENIQLALDLQTGLDPIRSDRPQLENALLNLCINARDAMPAGGHLTIRTESVDVEARDAMRHHELKPGSYVRLSVTDTGTGMEPPVLKKAFDPFFTTKPLGQGTGLGLSMVYDLTRQTGGTVELSSEVGVGTTVSLLLPCPPDAVEEQADIAEPQSEPSRGREVVVFVEDEPDVRAMLGEVLNDLGYEAHGAHDAGSGLALLESLAEVQLLVTDIGLPGMNGRELAQRARAGRPGLKVLFVTAYAGAGQPTVRAELLRPGMDMLTKPFTIDAFASKVKTLIQAPARGI